MTESQSVSADGSVFFSTNVTPADVTVNSSSGSGTASVNVVDDGYYVNETGGSSSVTIDAHDVMFNVSDNVSTTGSVADAINVSDGAGMENRTELVSDDDDSEVHDFRVRTDDQNDHLMTDISVDNGEFNETTGEYVPNETGNATFTVEVTRDNTTYESLDFEDHSVIVSFDKSGFTDIDETTNESAGVLELSSDGVGDFLDDGDEDKGYKYNLVEANNTTRTHTLTFTTTVENANENKSVVVESVHDPKGGVEADTNVSYALNNAGTANQLIGIPLSGGLLVTLLGGLVAVLAVGAVVIGRDGSSSMAGFGAYSGMGMSALVLGGGIVGLTMVADYVLEGFTFWSSIVVDGLGLPGFTPLVLGIVLSIGGAALTYKKSDSTDLM
ncbi:hypothetical protein ACFQER_02965 [Halomicroarcula sp. GCM10025894]|uniref:hypothetical protein n=1 Tax=Halomicroarcula sp. GCM10025894 TaxID=3252673 RepID=UPI003610D23B